MSIPVRLMTRQDFRMRPKTQNEPRNLMTPQILNETINLTTLPKKFGGGQELVSANNLDFLQCPNVTAIVS